MSRPDFFSQLPSIEELLEHPRVAPVLDRLNQSAAAAQVRTAISSLSAEVARRTEGWQSLGAAEILERLVRQLERPRSTHASQCINATGRYFDPAIARRPLATAAVEALRIAADGAPTATGARSAEAATRLWNAEAAWVAPSANRALATVLESLLAGGTLVVARGEMRELAPGVRLDALCRRCGITLVEVGASDAVSPEDYRSALATGGPRAALLRSPIDLAALKAVAAEVRSAGALVLVEAGLARPRHDTPAYLDTAPTVEDCLALPADVVVVDAAGWLGGPTAGIAVGARAALGVVAASPAARLDAVEPLVDEALAATLELFARPGDLRFSHPLHQLLDAPLENLQQRAERLAVRFAACNGIASAEPLQRTSSLRPGAWGVRVGPAQGDPSELQTRLASATPSVLACLEEGAVVLDLATVSPSQDSALVAALGPEPSPRST